MSPVRIQRKRTKGYRLPPDAIYVGRPTRWGNPVRVGDHVSTGSGWRSGGRQVMTTFARDRHDLEVYFRSGMRDGGLCVGDGLPPVELPTREAIRAELAGRDLACWCPLDEPCHADVLLRIANEVPGDPDELPVRGAS